MATKLNDAPLPVAAPTASLTSVVTLGGGGGANDSSGPEETSTKDSISRESMSAEWTDEKHSLYLDSMEASFVDQLYNSFDVRGWRSQQDPSSEPKPLHSNNSIPSRQFKVLQGDHWSRVDLEKNEPHFNKVDVAARLLANPWIRHFSSGSRCRALPSSVPPQKAASGRNNSASSRAKAETSSPLNAKLKQFPVFWSHIYCPYDSVGSITEVTDQNFVDEDVRGEENHECNAKRIKTSAVSTPSNDQIVPFSMFMVTSDAGEGLVPPQKERSRSSSCSKCKNDNGFP